MKFKSLLPQLVTGLALMTLAVACKKSDDGTDDSGPTYTEEDLALLKTFTNDVVLVTYKSLDDNAAALEASLTTLRDTPSQANFNAAKTAWLATRVPWEQSEGFLSGPVDSLGLDPAMDTWPVKPAQITEALGKVSGNTVQDLTTLDAEVKGFHAIEFLLYGEAGAKTYASQTAEERSYLVSLAHNVHAVTTKLYTSWNVSFDDGDSYADRFMNSGVKSGAAFATSTAAIADMVEKMAGIAEEVGTGKIGGPHIKDPDAAIESEYSDNSLTDFQDNIRSMRHVYRGTTTGDAVATSLSARVKAKDATLDAKVETMIDAALAAVAAIPAPFRVSATADSADARITAAEDALRQLQELVTNSVAEAVK